jgi:hypothetical protein
MEATHYCYNCETEKTRADLRQMERDETCLYACCQCGAVEGLWLQPLPPAPAAAAEAAARPSARQRPARR